MRQSSEPEVVVPPAEPTASEVFVTELSAAHKELVEAHTTLTAAQAALDVATPAHAAAVARRDAAVAVMTGLMARA